MLFGVELCAEDSSEKHGKVVDRLVLKESPRWCRLNWRGSSLVAVRVVDKGRKGERVLVGVEGEEGVVHDLGLFKRKDAGLARRYIEAAGREEQRKAKKQDSANASTDQPSVSGPPAAVDGRWRLHVPCPSCPCSMRRVAGMFSFCTAAGRGGVCVWPCTVCMGAWDGAKQSWC